MQTKRIVEIVRGGGVWYFVEYRIPDGKVIFDSRDVDYSHRNYFDVLDMVRDFYRDKTGVVIDTHLW